MCLISSAGNLLRPATNPTARSRSAGAAPQRPSSAPQSTRARRQGRDLPKRLPLEDARGIMTTFNRREFLDRKSTRLNSSHDQISYAVFCLKKKKNKKYNTQE